MGKNFLKVTVFGLVFMAATLVSGAELLKDDFTDFTFSRSKWTVFPPVDGINVTVGGGNCVINNTSNRDGGFLHTFSTPKPSTFTFSFVLKSAPRQDIGAMFCRQSGNNYNGYQITTIDDNVIVFKYVNNEGSSIFYQKSGDINSSGNNKFTISKQGSIFHVFVNDMFQGEFIDSEFNTGDVLLLVDKGVSAQFGTVHITDEFTEGKHRTSFSDNFNDNNLKYWKYLYNDETNKNRVPEINVQNGVLLMKTGDSLLSCMYGDINLTDFSASVEVQHKSGSTSSESSQYGIVLIGETEPGKISTVAYFGIAGNQTYIDKDNIIRSNPAIKGSAGTTGVVFIDTIEVKRQAGSSNYEFIVNGTTLANDYPVGNHKIVGIGIFCHGNLEIEFDNFHAEQHGTISVTWKTNPRFTNSNRQVIKNTNSVFYDLKGRKRITAASASSKRGASVRAAGVYVNENGRDIRVRKTRQK
ncbi:MAG: hypothetical protein LBI42_02660 [Chitinispirillales bacterium]|jgi:hypothetical protein|nr:hypothetical protein [Chitinispirillales bacterium]